MPHLFGVGYCVHDYLIRFECEARVHTSSALIVSVSVFGCDQIVVDKDHGEGLKDAKPFPQYLQALLDKYKAAAGPGGTVNTQGVCFLHVVANLTFKFVHCNGVLFVLLY